MTLRRRHRERGAAAVEMAIMMPLLLLFIAAIIDFGRFFYTQNITVNAAREGSRMMALNYSQAQATTRIGQAMIAFPPSDYTVTYTYMDHTGTTDSSSTAVCPGANNNTPDPNDRFRVKIEVNTFNYLILGSAVRLFGGGAGSFSNPKPNGVAEMRCGG